MPLVVDMTRYCLTNGTFFMCVAALSDPPIFAEPIPNVTVALGRDVSLPCVIENLGSYKVTYWNRTLHKCVLACSRDLNWTPPFLVSRRQPVPLIPVIFFFVPAACFPSGRNLPSFTKQSFLNYSLTGLQRACYSGGSCKVVSYKVPFFKSYLRG